MFKNAQSGVAETSASDRTHRRNGPNNRLRSAAFVAVVQPIDLLNRDHFSSLGRADRASDRTIFLQ